jgi:hypothetical protein
LSLRVVSIFPPRHASISPPLSCGVDQAHLPYPAARFELPSPIWQRGSNSPPLSDGSLLHRSRILSQRHLARVQAPLGSPATYLSTDPLYDDGQPSCGADEHPRRILRNVMIRLDIVYDRVLDNKFNVNYKTVID